MEVAGLERVNTYEVEELEGGVMNLGEREWGVSDRADAVFASSLDTCALVVFSDESLVGAVHFRSMLENSGVIEQINKRFMTQDKKPKVGVVWGRLDSPQSEVHRAVIDELRKIGVSEYSEDSGPNGMWQKKTGLTEAVEELPAEYRQRITEYYKGKLRKTV